MNQSGDNRDLLLLGTGGHAQVLFSLIQKEGAPLKGAIAPGQCGSFSFGSIPILGDDQYLKSLEPNSVRLVNGIGSVGLSDRRHEIFLEFVQLGFSFRSVIDSSTKVFSFIDPHSGIQIMAGAIVQIGAEIGGNVLINTGVIVEHHCKIEDGVHIASGAILCGGVRVGKGSFIGAGSTVIQAIKIGEGVTVGAGSVVIRDVPDFATVVGNPAKVLLTKS
jgi:UDP-perosamine 4-acetyltransferase